MTSCLSSWFVSTALVLAWAKIVFQTSSADLSVQNGILEKYIYLQQWHIAYPRRGRRGERTPRKRNNTKKQITKMVHLSSINSKSNLDNIQSPTEFSCVHYSSLAWTSTSTKSPFLYPELHLGLYIQPTVVALVPANPLPFYNIPSFHSWIIGKFVIYVMKNIVVVYRGNSGNNKVLSFVSRYSHLGCISRRFDCILLVFIRRWGRMVTRNLINHYVLLWLAGDYPVLHRSCSLADVNFAAFTRNSVNNAVLFSLV